MVEGYQFEEEDYTINDGFTHDDIQTFYKKHDHLFRKAKIGYLLKRI